MLQDVLAFAWYVVPSLLIGFLSVWLWRSVSAYLDACDRTYGGPDGEHR